MESSAAVEKEVMVVGVDESDHSMYALEWAVGHFFAPFAPNYPFKLVIVHAKPIAPSVVALVGSGAPEVLLQVDSDLKRTAAIVIEKAKTFCASKSVNDAITKVMEGDAREVLCEAVEKHRASMLVVGSHGYGAVKRAVLGSVSDHCAHYARCSLMIVKKPKTKP